MLRFANQRLAASDDLARWSAQLCDRDVHILSMPLDFDRLPTPSPVPDDGYVLGVGRLVPEKGFDVLIDAGGKFGGKQSPTGCDCRQRPRTRNASQEGFPSWS